MREALGADPASALAGASPYLRLFGLALGGACLAKAGLAAQDQAARGDETQRGRIGLARFFAEKLATAAPGLARSILSGAGALDPYEADSGGDGMSELGRGRARGRGSRWSRWRGRRRRTR